MGNPIVGDIVERLRKTTEEMALSASVEMDLWDRHSNACLEAADHIVALETQRNWMLDIVMRAMPTFQREYPNGQLIIDMKKVGDL
jgi:hypothetical protein